MQKNEGCHLWGDLRVAKVAGNIQIAPGKTYVHLGQLVHDLQPLRNMRLDISHRIASLTFGDAYPGQRNPLSGTSFDQTAKSIDNPGMLPGASLLREGRLARPLSHALLTLKASPASRTT